MPIGGFAFFARLHKPEPPGMERGEAIGVPPRGQTTGGVLRYFGGY